MVNSAKMQMGKITCPRKGPLEGHKIGMWRTAEHIFPLTKGILRSPQRYAREHMGIHLCKCDSTQGFQLG